jgi:hypothetical protein
MPRAEAPTLFTLRRVALNHSLFEFDISVTPVAVSRRSCHKYTYDATPCQPAATRLGTWAKWLSSSHDGNYRASAGISASRIFFVRSAAAKPMSPSHTLAIAAISAST